MIEASRARDMGGRECNREEQAGGGGGRGGGRDRDRRRGGRLRRAMQAPGVDRALALWPAGDPRKPDDCLWRDRGASAAVGAGFANLGVAVLFREGSTVVVLNALWRLAFPPAGRSAR